jgi:glycosyltransferase involved in cell wall biosynthesis
MPKLTVLIPCKNEVHNIRACIESVRPVADEILVADSGSSDGTLEIVRELGGCRVIEREFINYADFKNWAIPHAQHEWVLVVDADERMTPELASEIRDLIAFEPNLDAYGMQRQNFFLGHPIRHCGWNRSYIHRLFRRDTCRYRYCRVHEEVDVPASRVGKLREKLLHYTAVDLDEFIAKQQRYATWSALDAYDAGKRASWLRLLTHAPLRFLQLYVLRGGWLDGRAGAVVCGITAWYTFLKDAKLWAMRNCRVPSLDADRPATQTPPHARRAAA